MVLVELCSLLIIFSVNSVALLEFCVMLFSNVKDIVEEIFAFRCCAFIYIYLRF